MKPETKATLIATWQRFRGALVTHGHHVRAAGWVVGDAAYQLALREPGGPASVMSWSAKRWAYAMGEALFPALLLLLKAGDKTPTTEELTAAVEKRISERPRVGP